MIDATHDMLASFLHRREHITKAILAINATKIGEIGVLHGEHFLRMMSAPCVEFGYAIDTWENIGPVSARDHMLPQSELDKMYDRLADYAEHDHRVRLHRKSSLQAADDFIPDFFDVLYIDADHTYDAVKADIDAWWPKVRPGGILCGHDYMRYKLGCGVTFGVVEAVNEFVQRNGLPLHVDGDREGFPSWYIPKPAIG